MLKNTRKAFGHITKLLHWLIFILISTQFYLIWYPNVFPKDSPQKLQYLMLHKSIGITVLILGLLFIIWHRINEKPQLPEAENRWRRLAAKTVHQALLTLLVLMPTVGYLLSCADGRTVNFFGWFTLPCLIAENKNLGDYLYLTHAKLGYLILILVSIHIIAALYHHFILKDDVLKRMRPF